MGIVGGYDGSIRIDSSISSKGFNSGIKSMIGSLSKLGAALAVVFGARAIFTFGKSTVAQASEMAGALIGLQSIVEGTGNSFAQAKKFLTEYTEDGLVPLTNASLALKNLLARGYSFEQAEQTLIRLKNAAAFSRQSHLTMGQAVQSATEGLKNENSILVDNAGVTKNVSMMWKDYAASIGTTVGMLTKEQKIQAEVNGIMEETKFQMNDAAKASKTYAGQTAALGVSIVNLKVAIGKSIIPFLTAIMPTIKAIIDALTVYFNRLAMFVSLFFGVDISEQATSMNNIADSSNEAADAQENLGDETAKAAKKAKGALAAWDELNVLQQSDTDVAATPEVITPELDEVVVDQGLEGLKSKVEDFKKKLIELFTPAIEGFNRFKEALKPLTKTLWEGLLWAWNHILKPFGEWAIRSVLPRLFDLLAAGVRFLNAALIALKPAFLWLWENIFLPFAKGVGQLILMSIEGWTMGFNKLAAWLESHPDLFANFGHAAEEVWIVIQEKWAQAGQWLKDNVINALRVLFAILWMEVRDLALLAYTRVTGIWGKLVLWAVLQVLDPLKENFKLAFDSVFEIIRTSLINVQNSFMSILNFVIGVIRPAMDSVRDRWIGSMSAILSFFLNSINTIQNAFSNMSNWLRNTFDNAFGNLGNIVRSAFNSMIDKINGLLSRVANAINTMANIVNQFSWMMGGFHIPTVNVPSIPHLASGAVIPPNAEFLAVMGDQRSGRNLEAPESLIRQIIREELGGQNNDVAVNNVVTLDGEVIFQNQRRVSLRHGRSLLSSGST